MDGYSSWFTWNWLARLFTFSVNLRRPRQSSQTSYKAPLNQHWAQPALSSTGTELNRHWAQLAPLNWHWAQPALSSTGTTQLALSSTGTELNWHHSTGTELNRHWAQLAPLNRHWAQPALSSTYVGLFILEIIVLCHIVKAVWAGPFPLIFNRYFSYITYLASHLCFVKNMLILPSLCCHCWLGSREGIWPVIITTLAAISKVSLELSHNSSNGCCCFMLLHIRNCRFIYLLLLLLLLTRIKLEKWPLNSCIIITIVITEYYLSAVELKKTSRALYRSYNS